jgi:tetratricopeptide (TPR) repeat protein
MLHSMQSCTTRASLVVTGLALVACVLGIGGVARSQQGPAGAAVIPVRVSPEIAPAVEGLAEHLRARLSEAGVATVSGDVVRRALGPVDGLTDAAALQLAREQRTARAVLLDVRVRDGSLEVVLRAHDTADGQLIAVGRATGPVASAASLAEQALKPLAPTLDASFPAPAPEAIPTVEALSAASSALHALDSGALARAWRETEAHVSLSPLRAQIQAAARRAPHDERVRLLVVMGEADMAWNMVFARAETQLTAAQAKPEVMLAAGEAKLALGQVAEAQAYLDRAISLAPESAEAHEGRGRAQQSAGALAAARESFAKAHALDPTLDRLELLAGASTDDPVAQGETLLRAAELASAELRPDTARSHFGEARALAPALGPTALDGEAALFVRVQEPEAARASAGLAIELGGKTTDRLVLLGRSARMLGEMEIAESAYREAHTRSPSDAEILEALGVIETETGRVGDGLVSLTRASELDPESPSVVRSLARAKRQSGESAEALALFDRAESLAPGNGHELLEMAELQQAVGDSAAAQRTLEHAAEIEPGLAEIYTKLSDVYEQNGHPELAARYDALSRVFGGGDPSGDDGAIDGVSESIDTVVDSFFAYTPRPERVTILEIREPRTVKERALDWVLPRIPDVARIELSIAASIGRYAEIAPKPTLDAYSKAELEQLFAFESDASLERARVIRMNALYGTDAMFIARLSRRKADSTAPSVCGVTDHYVLETRLLIGRLQEQARLLGNAACIPNADVTFGRWNPRAIALLVALLSMIVFPMVRGYGRLTVKFILPPKARPFLSVRVTKRRVRVKDGDAPMKDDAKWRLREKLQTLHRNERRLVDGNSVEFRRLPARRREYVVTVRGPLMEFQSEDVIGTFNAEKTIKVVRGTHTELEFDMRPKQACVEVHVLRGGAFVPDARVGLRGDSRSLRFTRGRPAYLYLDPGSYVIVAGGAGAAAEKPLEVPNRDPIQVTFDLYDTLHVVFSDCNAAVLPYLEGHFTGAATALDAAGQRAIAARVRAAADRPRAATTLVASPPAKAPPAAIPIAPPASDEAPDDIHEGAPIRVGEATHSAPLGGRSETARALLERGELREAASAFEEAYDFDGAAECYRKLGDWEALLRALEQSGDRYEAARVACKLEAWDRAIENLKEIDQRHRSYTEACVMMAEVLLARGDDDLAMEKFDEAISRSSTDGVALESLARHAGLLERAGRYADAMEVYRRIRRVDHAYPGAKEKLEALRQLAGQQSGLATQQTQLPPNAASMYGSMTQAPCAGGGLPSRYEVIGELGRGAMGIVYKARDTVLDRLVALKTLPDHMRENELAVKYFLREARSAASLNHPNVVTIYDAGQEGTTYFITMEHLEGTPLDAVQKRVGKLSARDTSILGMQAATGLAYAHESGIIHRDIKASNLFYTRDRTVKIMDFGLAKAVEEARKQATVIAGTPYYMPPEQAVGGIVDHRSDLYSLGVTLFQLSTGTVPFANGDIAYHHAHTPAPDIRERVPELPEALAALILRMMAKDPDARVQTAEEVYLELRPIAESR